MQKITEHFIWEDIAIAEYEKKHDIEAKAKRDGMGDEPPSDSESLSGAENEIKLECDTFIERHATKLRTFFDNIEQKQNELSTHLQQNHFEPVYDKLKLEFDASSRKKAIVAR